ncbi:MAG: SDR family oxidoreductase [Tissierellia bacterium]|nr:SDR family oxidoreductase [Tissierellia bacterium]
MWISKFIFTYSFAYGWKKFHERGDFTKLKDRIAIVTGGGSGIGQSIAMELAKEGAKLALVGRTLGKLETTVEKLKEINGEAIAVSADVSDSAQVQKMVQEVINHYGRIDILCNTAGIFDGPNDYLETEEEVFESVMNINVTGTFLVSKYVLPHMLKQGKGVVINTSSVAGIRSCYASPAYTASKHAVIGLTGDMAVKYATKGIRSVAVCPGFIETEMISDLLGDKIDENNPVIAPIPMKRLGRVEEIGKVFAFLASDDASYISGVPIIVDGALTV